MEETELIRLEKVVFSGDRAIMHNPEYSVVNSIVLNQYRKGSGYKDEIGRTYHFPARYIRRFDNLPVRFIYYEPRDGGDQVYFGCGIVGAVVDDTEDLGHFYADLTKYHPFVNPVDFYAASEQASTDRRDTWEHWSTMRNSVRSVSDIIFDGIISAGGLRPSSLSPTAFPVTEMSLHTDRLEAELAHLNQTKTPEIRKIQRVYESYERPSAITKAVKHARGYTCQLCGVHGFIKRNGQPYCEVHHAFHLSKNPPIDGLTARFLIVLCATCHRRMHYADVEDPIATPTGWSILIDGQEVNFITEQQPD